MTIKEKREPQNPRYNARKTPETIEKARERSRVHREKRRYEGPEAYKQRAHAAYVKYLQPKLLTDPERYHAKISEHHARRHRIERYRRGQILKQWFFKHAWVRDELPWKSHRPVLYDQNTGHYCAGCEWTKYGGRRLWFKNLVDESYLCQSCYIPPSPDWDQIMPKGYEDIKTLKDLKARKQQLDGSGAPPSR
ncbi:unnamed protein product [Aureobasidium vineae]|uniref:Uncharacterized protein n=1 Tax=Aureobasidium vineae TaxID=2773715 RepID=A0A9N8P5L3_9PEZI|nr:unnamed protein product [Aureobasidium vineae]